MKFNDLNTYLWLALGVLAVSSVYLMVEGYRVHKIFSESIVGKLVKTLVVVLLIEIYSLGIVCFAFLTFYPKGITVIVPIVVLWIISVLFAIFAVRSAKREVAQLVKK